MQYQAYLFKSFVGKSGLFGVWMKLFLIQNSHSLPRYQSASEQLWQGISLMKNIYLKGGNILILTLLSILTVCGIKKTPNLAIMSSKYT